LETLTITEKIIREILFRCVGKNYVDKEKCSCVSAVYYWSNFFFTITRIKHLLLKTAPSFNYGDSGRRSDSFWRCGVRFLVMWCISVENSNCSDVHSAVVCQWELQLNDGDARLHNAVEVTGCLWSDCSSICSAFSVIVSHTAARWRSTDVLEAV